MSPRDLANLRASDADREAVVTLLGDHHGAGRIKLEEFEDRVSAAYKATTIGQLKNLLRDLPMITPSRPGESAKDGAAKEAPAWLGSLDGMRPQPFGHLTGGQKAMRVLWTIWTAAVSVNVVVWVLSSIAHGGPMYFWPAWVAGPTGAVLGSVTWFSRPGHRASKKLDQGPASDDRRW